MRGRNVFFYAALSDLDFDFFCFDLQRTTACVDPANCTRAMAVSFSTALRVQMSAGGAMRSVAGPAQDGAGQRPLQQPCVRPRSSSAPNSGVRAGSEQHIIQSAY
jgi:hypothetical protein